MKTRCRERAFECAMLRSIVTRASVVTSRPLALAASIEAVRFLAPTVSKTTSNPDPEVRRSTGAELLFEVVSQRYERGAIIVTSNLPFDEWTGVFASERLTGTLLDRLTHHVHILQMNGDSFRLKHSKRRIKDDQPLTEPG